MCIRDRPPGMLGGMLDVGDSTDDYWPPPCDQLHIVIIDIISLHNLPKRGESRPRYDGARVAAHKFAPELSGTASPPNGQKPSSPLLTLELHPVG
eukprot:3750354-Prymnesium_polylepis.1